MTQATLCLLVKRPAGGHPEILLAMKKRGFGVGRWNGSGGKFDAEKDKTILDTAIRETQEEIGVEVKNLEKFGLFHFTFPHKPEWDQDVHLFLAKEWTGEPTESEEMMPAWFSFDAIPYESMWPTDIHWLPDVLQGKKMEASFVFSEGDKVEKFNIKVLNN